MPITSKSKSPKARTQRIKKSTDQITADLLAANRKLRREIAKHKQSDEQLRKLLRAIEQSQITVVITDTTGKIEYVNPKFVDITGYSIEEVLGQNPRLLKSGETSQAEYERLWNTILSGRDWHGVFHNRKKNGELYWEQAIISPIFDTAGRITHFVAVKEDITERRRLDEALRASESSYRALARNFPDSAVFLFDRDLRYLVADGEALHQGGFSPESMIGKTLAEVRSTSPNLAQLTRIYQAAINGNPTREELISGNQTFAVTSVPVKDAAGQIIAGMVITQDITERKRTENALLEREERLSLATKASGQGVWDWNIVRDEAYLSPRYYELTGYTEGEIHPDSIFFSSLIHPDDAPSVAKSMADHIQGLTEYSIVEYRMRKKSGEYRWTRGVGQVVERDVMGAPVRMAGVIHDMTERKEAEQALLVTNERLRVILDTTVSAIITIDEQGLIETFNRAAREMFGYDEDEVIGRNVSLLMPEPFHSKHAGYIEHYLRTGIRSVIGLRREVTGLRKNGTTFLMGLSVSEVLLGNLRWFTGVARDITEIKQTQDALRASEAQLALIFDSTSDMLALFRVEGGDRFIVQAVNRTFMESVSRLFPAASLDIIGKERSDYLREFGVPPEAIEAELPHYRAAIEQRTVIRYESVFPVPAASITLDVSISPVLNQTGGCTHVLWSAHDISERKRMEAALTESEARFRSLYESSPDAILMTAPDGRIFAANAAACQLFGYTEAELIQLGRNAVMDRTDPRLAAALAERERTGWFRGELTMLKRGGQAFPGELSSSIFRDKDGLPKTSMIIRDMTERQQAEETLRRHVLELDARNTELDTFGHTVAHDLKSPLSSILGFSQLLLSDDNDFTQTEVQESLQNILKSGQKMDRIIEELMLLTGVRQQEIAPAPFDLAQTLGEALSNLSRTIQQTGAQITVLNRAHWPQALGYAPWIEHVWFNYLTNAMKYGGQPPHIELGVDLLAGGQVRGWVHDDGPGLTLEERNQLFTPFTRLEQVRAKGHGLGLSIVKRIVEKLGGTVGVESEIDSGSTFYFTLPTAAPEKI